MTSWCCFTVYPSEIHPALIPHCYLSNNAHPTYPHNHQSLLPPQFCCQNWYCTLCTVRSFRFAYSWIYRNRSLDRTFERDCTLICRRPKCPWVKKQIFCDLQLPLTCSMNRSTEGIQCRMVGTGGG